jgi:hypothetical protein
LLWFMGERKYNIALYPGSHVAQEQHDIFAGSVFANFTSLRCRTIRQLRLHGTTVLCVYDTQWLGP